jgi:hypothetical protein
MKTVKKKKSRNILIHYFSIEEAMETMFTNSHIHRFMAVLLSHARFFFLLIQYEWMDGMIRVVRLVGMRAIQSRSFSCLAIEQCESRRESV